MLLSSIPFLPRLILILGFLACTSSRTRTRATLQGGKSPKLDQAGDPDPDYTRRLPISDGKGKYTRVAEKN